MQAPECTFILRNGSKCRAAANRNQNLCRHHAPKPAVPPPPPIPKNELYSNLARWRRLGLELKSMPEDEIPLAVWQILQCLIDRGPDVPESISDLTAGRFLRALLNRLGNVPFPDPEFSEAPSACFPPQASRRPAKIGGAIIPADTAPAAERIAAINQMIAGYGLPPVAPSVFQTSANEAKPRMTPSIARSIDAHTLSTQ